jgi:hypothetical protein
MGSNPALTILSETQTDIDIDDCTQVYADESALSLFATPRCPRNADGLYCDHGDAIDPTRCRYCGAPAP